MADEALLRKVHRLGDLELAALLCLVAREHCLVSTPADRLDELIEELSLVATKTFGLRPVVVSCHAHTTVDEFASALLLPPAALQTNESTLSVAPSRARADLGGPGYFSSQVGSSSLRSAAAYPYSPTSPGSSVVSPAHLPHHQYHAAGAAPPPPPGSMGNVVLAKNLDQAPKAVQIQALELLRTRRIFTRTAVQAAPKQFLLMAVVGAPSGGQARVVNHLNDYLYLAHWHDREDGFAHLDEAWGVDDPDAGMSDDNDDDDDDDDDATSTSSSASVLRKSQVLGSAAADGKREGLRGGGRPFGHAGEKEEEEEEEEEDDEDDESGGPVLTETDISHLAALSRQVRVDIDVVRYQMNIVSFLRMHRAVAGGITPTATKHSEQLIKSLASLHGLDFATPSLVSLAAKKIYLHRIRIVHPDKERSMQWGSELAAIEAVLDGVGPEEVIEDVLDMVGIPQ